MGKSIRINISSAVVEAELNETKTASAIWQALPINSVAKTWGQEIYFSIPLNIDSEDGKEVVNAGDIGYWPPGKAFCLFFGPTPASRGDEIRAASPVNIFGKIIGDFKVLNAVRDGEKITVEGIEE